MNYLIDTCVLFPTVMRTILLEAVKSKHDSAFWSEKILSEWSASAKKVGAWTVASRRRNIHFES